MTEYVLYSCSSLGLPASVRCSFGSVCSVWRVINYFSCHYRENLTEWRSALFLCSSTCEPNTRENTHGEHTCRHTKTPFMLNNQSLFALMQVCVNRVVWRLLCHSVLTPACRLTGFQFDFKRTKHESKTFHNIIITAHLVHV